MFRSYHLQPIRKQGSPITFDWNPTTGGVRGPSAALVIQLANQARMAGEVVGHPYPTPHIITDPLRDHSDLAVVLGNDWILTPDLAEAYPQPETDDPIVEIDEIGKERPSGFEPLN